MSEKKLGFGLMRLPLRNPDNAGDIDTETVCAMVDQFLRQGFTYFDTAWMYCGFRSENAVKEVLVDRYPRDAYTLATKLHCGFISIQEDRDSVFIQQLEKTGAGYFDYYLLHGIEADTIGKYEQLDCFNWLREKKRQGLVKHMGFSFHASPELLDQILTKYPDMEFVQLQINYLDWDSPWIRARECYETARKHGKPILIMEPVKGGTLAKLPEEAEKLLRSYNPNASAASWAIRFAAGLPGVKLVLSGMSTPEQVEDNLSFMKDFRPLTQEERNLCFRVAQIINTKITVACTGCSYCTAGCPKNIPIPKYFSLYNEDMREAEGKGWGVNSNYYDSLARTFGAAKSCIGCGQCESVCPQHLPIIEALKKVSKQYD